MTDYLVQAVLSNLMVSAILAAIAWTIQKRIRSASLVNLLWIIVLIKMVTPPLFMIPLIEVGSLQSSSQTNSADSIAVSNTLPSAASSGSADVPITDILEIESTTGTQVSMWLTATIIVWLTVSILLIILSTIRIFRFQRLLKSNAQNASPRLNKQSATLSKQMGLGRPPRVCISQAQVSPFVWWLGGRPQIVLSNQSVEALSCEDLRLVLAHEMAHIKRWDHLVRWLEWSAGILLWWNPLMWWARRQLRTYEEIACDELVIESIRTERHTYATSLLNMAEVVSTTAIRPPQVVSAMNSGGNLEKRLTMIIAEKSWKVPSALRLGIVVIAFCIFPLGLVYAQDMEAVERRLGGAVEAGELTLEQASQMMDALRESAHHEEHEYHDHSHDEPSLEEQIERRKQFEKHTMFLIEKGVLSPKEAQQRLAQVRLTLLDVNRMEAEQKHGERSSAEKRMRRLRFAEFEAKLEELIKAGEISKKDAEKKLIAAKEELFGDAGKNTHSEEHNKSQQDERRGLVLRKKKYAEAEQRMEIAVKKGLATKEEAKEKLHEIRVRLFGDAKEAAHNDQRSEDHRDRKRKLEILKRQYEEANRQLKVAVEQEKISNEEADKKLLEYRVRLFGEESGKKETKNHEAKNRTKARQRGDKNEDLNNKRKAEFEKVAREVRVLVESGHLSKEDAEKKLGEIKQKMFGEAISNEKKDKAQPNAQQQKRRMEAALKRLNAAVESGQISKEDAASRLKQLKEKMSGDK